jgi:N-methylhydantoinase A
LNVPYSRDLPQAFQREHQRRYGYSYDKRELELVTLRLRAIVKPSQISWKHEGIRTLARSPERGTVFMSGKPVPTLIYDREALSTGKTYTGPVIVTEYSATTVIPPKTTFRVDGAGNLVVLL